MYLRDEVVWQRKETIWQVEIYSWTRMLVIFVAIGLTTARLGLGTLVNIERFPDADVILHTQRTQWTALAGKATPVFVGVCYVPCGPESDISLALS